MELYLHSSLVREWPLIKHKDNITFFIITRSRPYLIWIIIRYVHRAAYLTWDVRNRTRNTKPLAYSQATAAWYVITNTTTTEPMLTISGVNVILLTNRPSKYCMYFTNYRCWKGNSNTRIEVGEAYTCMSVLSSYESSACSQTCIATYFTVATADESNTIRTSHFWHQIFTCRVVRVTKITGSGSDHWIY
jgi:hypothetical protein